MRQRPDMKTVMLECSGLAAAIVFLLCSPAISQNTATSVATVGDEKISAREFKIRYELVPHLSPHQGDADSSKKYLLYSIIAEKLLAKEAASLGYASTDYYEKSIEIIADLYVRDALYRKVISSKVKIDKKDIQEALARFSRTLSVRIISAADSGTIYGYYDELKNGTSPDSIEKYSDPVEYGAGRPPVKITYGQMSDDRVEDILYRLKPGQYSLPVRTQDGWFIFVVVGIDYRVPPNADDPDYNKSIIEVIRMRKSREIGLGYLNKFYSDKHAVVDSLMFWSLAEKISAILSEKERDNDFGEEGNLYLSEGNLMRIMSDFGVADLGKEIVHAQDDPVSLKEYLYSLLVYPYLAKDPSLMSTARHLMANLNKYIQYKFLSREGEVEGLQNLQDVKEDVKIWADNYLAKMLKNSFRDSVNVTDWEVRDYYMGNNEREKVDILEIFSRNLDTLTGVMKKIENGADFRELATEYTENSSAKASGGDLGYRSVDSIGALGQIAVGMKLNEVYGPVKTDSGCSIIKLVGRRLEDRKREQVDIREILTHSLDTVEAVFRQLSAGQEFASLAKKYTERSWTRSDSGRFGYFSVYSFGDIGRIASRMKPGEVYGPVTTDSGYSVIKLIGRRYDTTKTDRDFEAEATELKSEVLEKKFDETFFKYVAGLAKKYGYSINMENLNEIKVIDIPMFTYKYIGFGGRITALPYLGPWYDWVKYFDRKSGPVP
ncbi:MAG TPA: peptidylprolyl isomerase [Candidatus Kryptonia bacterium]